MSPSAFPAIKPSAIAAGTVFSHVSSFLVSAPVFGAALQKAKQSETNEQFLKSREAAGAGLVYGSSLLGSGVQSYAVSALLHLTGATTYTGAAIVGGLVFVATAAPDLVVGALLEKRPAENLLAKTVTGLLDSVALSLVLVWWGYNANDLLPPPL